MTDKKLSGLYLTHEEFEEWTKKILRVTLEIRDGVNNEMIKPSNLYDIENYKECENNIKSWREFFEPEMPMNPSDPSRYNEILENLKKASMSGFSTQHPSFYGFVNGGVVGLSSISSLLVQTVNKFPAYISGPGFSQLETNCVRWFCEMVGYTDMKKSLGVFTSGSSIANLMGIVCARDVKKITSNDFEKCRVYVTRLTHCSIEKNLKIIGFPHMKVMRFVKVKNEENYAMDTKHLEKLILEDLDNNLIPFLIVGTLGTTDVGSIDNCLEISRISKKYDIRFHVDAAIGGFYSLTDMGKIAFKGMEKADSIAMDCHKSLLLPYGVGVCLVKEKMDLINSFAISSLDKDQNYIPKSKCEMDEINPIYNLFDVSMELSRPIRGISCWLPLKIFGFKTFKRELERHQLICKLVRDELMKIKNIEVLTKQENFVIPIIAFRWTQGDLEKEDLEMCNTNTRYINIRINELGNLLSFTFVENFYCIRICLMNILTKEKNIMKLIKDIKRTRNEVKNLKKKKC